MERYSVIGDIRGLGMIIGIELVRYQKIKEPALEISQILSHECLKRGVLINFMHGIFRIIPPLTITIDKIDYAVDSIEASLKDAFYGKATLSESILKNPNTNRLRPYYTHWVIR